MGAYHRAVGERPLPAVNPVTVKVLDLDEVLASGETDDWVILNRLRAAQGKPPLTEADFAAFDAHLSDPTAGPLVL